MAVLEIKENVRLKLELDGGLDGDKEIIKSKIYTRIRPEATSQDLFDVANNLAGLQVLPLSKVKRLEEVHIKEEI